MNFISNIIYFFMNKEFMIFLLIVYSKSSFFCFKKLSMKKSPLNGASHLLQKIVGINCPSLLGNKLMESQNFIKK